MIARLLFNLALFGLATIFFLFGLGFLSTALYFYLNTHLNPTLSALISGLIILLIAILLLISLKIMSHVHSTRRKTKINSMISSLLPIVNKHFSTSICTILGIGFLIGFSKKARHILIKSTSLIIKKQIKQGIE